MVSTPHSYGASFTRSGRRGTANADMASGRSANTVAIAAASATGPKDVTIDDSSSGQRPRKYSPGESFASDGRWSLRRCQAIPEDRVVLECAAGADRDARERVLGDVRGDPGFARE